MAAMGVGIVLTLCACSREEKKVDQHETSGLYIKMCNLTRSYTDSIMAAKDSTQLTQLLDRYELRVDALNFEVSPDTDYQLSEGQNDTIVMLMQKLQEARDSRLHSFRSAGNQSATESDSVPS